MHPIITPPACLPPATDTLHPTMHIRISGSKCSNANDRSITASRSDSIVAQRTMHRVPTPSRVHIRIIIIVVLLIIITRIMSRRSYPQ